MKKKTKKLALAKETVRNLEDGKLEKVVGASDGSDRMCAGSNCLNCNTAYDCPPTSGSMYC
ncbi:MAG TPA: class I lanthipeptide [Thermoanaerobaculia bacterium]|nr:class I lanthipeptide [Thermoanaerobaculia bacterium]